VKKMETKRIGSLLIVGLLVLSVMVVVIGTAAAATRYPIRFEGTIPGADAGVTVVIERTEGSYTGTWTGETDSSGHFITEKKQFNLYKTDGSTVSGDYQMHIGGTPDEGKFIGVQDGPAWYNAPPETRDSYGFKSIQAGSQDCYYIYDWQASEIPEFSTIVIPVAMILGLLFFFNRRKHGKE
jgi:hypothetical protein